MTDTCKEIINFLNCDYELITNEQNEEKIINRFNELAEQGKTLGFYPLIIIPSDTLVEILSFFLADSKIENNSEAILAHRQVIIESALRIDARLLISTRIDEISKIFNSDITGQFVQTEPQTNLTLHMLMYDPCEEIIIAKIPTENPWELAAWIPMGGFNDCPRTEEQIAMFKYWYERNGAIPAVVTSDIWEMTLTKPPVTDEEAEALANEHYAFCYDLVLQGAETIRALASVLKNSSMWYFWWD